MSYTIKNLKEVEDAAASRGLGHIQAAHFARGDLDAEQTGIAYMAVKPGQKQGFAHRHEKAEEIYVVISGSGRIKLGDEVIDVGPMDAIRIAPDVTRALEAGDDGLEYLAFGPHHEKDGEILPADVFWGDA